MFFRFSFANIYIDSGIELSNQSASQSVSSLMAVWRQYRAVIIASMLTFDGNRYPTFDRERSTRLTE